MNELGRTHPVEAGVPISELLSDPQTQPSISRFSDDERRSFIGYQCHGRYKAALEAEWEDRSREWPANHLITFGRQNIEWNGDSRLQQWVAQRPHRSRRYTANFLAGRLADFAAALSQPNPAWTPVPPTPDLSGEQTAELAERVLLYDLDTLDIGLSRTIGNLNVGLCGMGIIETVWDEQDDVVPDFMPQIDPLMGPMMGAGNQPLYVQDEDTGEPVIIGAHYTGGIKVRPVSPFSFFVAPGMEYPSLRSCPWVIRTCWMTQGKIRQLYPKVVGPDFKFEDDRSDPETYQSMQYYLSSMAGGGASRKAYDAGKVLVKYYYERPSIVKGFERGKVYVTVGTRLVHEAPLDIPSVGYPFYTFPWLIRPGQFWPYPWITPLRDPQLRYNATVNHLTSLAAIFGMPNVYVAKGSGIDPKRFGFHGGVYSYTGEPPKNGDAPSAPGELFELLNRAMGDMDQAGHQFAGSRGQHQAGIPSGQYLRYLQDAARAMYGPIVNLHRESWERMGSGILELHRKHHKAEQLLDITGDDGKPSVFAFQGTKLPVRMRVRVQEETILPYLKSALQETATIYANMGLFGDVATDARARRYLGEYLNDPKLPKVQTPDEVQRNFIRQVHDQILREGIAYVAQPQPDPNAPPEQQQPPPPETPEQRYIPWWWDVDAHLEQGHERLLKDSLRWPPDASQRFDAYMQGLQQMQQQAEAADQAKQAEEQGAMVAAGADAEADAKVRVEGARATGKAILETLKAPPSNGVIGGQAGPPREAPPEGAEA